MSDKGNLWWLPISPETDLGRKESPSPSKPQLISQAAVAYYLDKCDGGYWPW